MTGISLADVPYEEFRRFLEKFRLLPDWYGQAPEIALALHSTRVVFEIARDGERLGLIWLDGRVPEVGWPMGAEMGIAVEKDYRGEIIDGKEAWPNPDGWYDKRIVDEFFRVCFDEMGLHRLTARFPHSRKRAEEWLKRQGFLYEGKSKDVEYHRGKLVTQITLGLTRRRYNEVKHESIYNPSGGDRDRRTTGAAGVEEVRVSRHGGRSEAERGREAPDSRVARAS